MTVPQYTLTPHLTLSRTHRVIIMIIIIIINRLHWESTTVLHILQHLCVKNSQACIATVDNGLSFTPGSNAADLVEFHSSWPLSTCMTGQALRPHLVCRSNFPRFHHSPIFSPPINQPSLEELPRYCLAHTSISIHLCCCVRPREEWWLRFIVWVRACAAAATAGSLCTGMERSSTALTAVLMASELGVGTTEVRNPCREGGGDELRLSGPEGHMIEALSASMGLPGAVRPSRACGVSADVASAASGRDRPPPAQPAAAAAEEVVDDEEDGDLHVRQGRSNVVSTSTSPLGPLKMMPQQTSVLGEDEEKIVLRKPHFNMCTKTLTP